MVSTSNIVTLSPYLSRSHLIRDVSSLGTAPSTSALPAQSNPENQHDTTNDSAIVNQQTMAITIAATAGCMGVLSILLLTLFRLYKRAPLARSQANTLDVLSLVSEWRVNAFCNNNMRIDPFTPGAWIDIDSNS